MILLRLKMKNKLFLLLSLIFFLFSEVRSQEYKVFRGEIENTEQKDISKPVTGYYSLEYGGISVLSTYLSPLTYKGENSAISGYWTKAMPFDPEKVIMEFKGDLSFSSLLNPAQTARMVGIDAAFAWGMAWRIKAAEGFQFTLGGDVQIAGGAFYLLRNSNNPVSALANFSLDLRASISQPFKIGKLPILFSDRIQIPTAGVFFNPQYGETYYEIYLGNLEGLAHFGWWGNNFRLNNLLSFTLDFGRTAMSIGYKLDVFNQWANNLNTRIIKNTFVIGVIPGGIGLKKRAQKLPDETIYAIY